MSCREGLPHYCPNCDRTFPDADDLRAQLDAANQRAQRAEAECARLREDVLAVIGTSLPPPFLARPFTYDDGDSVRTDWILCNTCGATSWDRASLRHTDTCSYQRRLNRIRALAATPPSAPAEPGDKS